jgi:hypothetical protein
MSNSRFMLTFSTLASLQLGSGEKFLFLKDNDWTRARFSSTHQHYCLLHRQETRMIVEALNYTHEMLMLWDLLVFRPFTKTQRFVPVECQHSSPTDTGEVYWWMKKKWRVFLVIRLILCTNCTSATCWWQTSQLSEKIQLVSIVVASSVGPLMHRLVDYWTIFVWSPSTVHHLCLRPYQTESKRVQTPKAAQNGTVDWLLSER